MKSFELKMEKYPRSFKDMFQSYPVSTNLTSWGLFGQTDLHSIQGPLRKLLNPSCFAIEMGIKYKSM